MSMIISVFKVLRFVPSFIKCHNDQIMYIIVHILGKMPDIVKQLPTKPENTLCRNKTKLEKPCCSYCLLQV